VIDEMLVVTVAVANPPASPSRDAPSSSDYHVRRLRVRHATLFSAVVQALRRAILSFVFVPRHVGAVATGRGPSRWASAGMRARNAVAREGLRWGWLLTGSALDYIYFK